jgi:polysaccharide biosynthesis/export protein
MYLQRQAWGKRVFIIASILLVALWGLAAYAQDSTNQQSTDSTTAAQPVIPADSGASSGKDVAKAAPLPSTDTPPSRVAHVRPDTYMVGIGDVLGISVWKEPELSKAVAVRPDGMITLPLIGEIKAVGLTPVQLQGQITAELEKVMSDPVVEVIVDSVTSLSYNLMGNVGRPGYFPLTRPVTVLDAIALAGGFKDFAKTKKIYILRANPDGTQTKIHFNYKQVIKGQNMAQNILVQPHDVIVVP